MSHRTCRIWVFALLIALASGSLLPLATAGAAPRSSLPAGPDALQDAFRAAAREFGVPERVLLAVSYSLSRWETHAGAPSFAGGYGPMHLTQVISAPRFDGKGLDSARPGINLSDPRLHTLEIAAALLGADPQVLKHDPAQNIRGGAALLARYARETTGTTPADESAWYGAVARYAGSPYASVARDFAEQVFDIMRQGIARTTGDGQHVTLPAADVTPDRSTADTLGLIGPSTTTAECPPTLACEFIPAAYTQNNPADPSDYGNYDLANRPDDGLDIRYIVIHNTEVDYNTTISGFQNPYSYTSAHYVLRSADGHIAQMVENKNVAWHAGNWYINSHAIGLEHEGIAIEGATWYTEQMYSASARLVRYLALKYRIPIDRAHIVGHDDIPGPTPSFQAGMHWDPGPFWDWSHYMDLIGAPISRGAGNPASPVVTINPDFASNTPAMTYCYGAEVADCRDVPLQPANFVYLYTAPDFAAPLITNPYIGADPTRANNWANKAVTGQQFVRVGQQGDWDAIYFSGQIAWFYNPTHATNTKYTRPPTIVTPKAGLASIPVYGRAYPEAETYPAGIPPQDIVPIYDMPAGQIYVATVLVKGDYYWAPTYAPTLEGSDHSVVEGQTEYYQIFFNHRFGFVKASDVELAPSS